MVRLALGFAVAAVVAACVPTPGLFLALGLGIAAIGLGLASYRRQELPGPVRLVAAAAVTLGCLASLLGVARVVFVLSAIAHVDHMLD